ncbi:hypothetical protein PROFUN_07464 [Planoprotostelium fungivorum]|uniref:PPM-type phosphatase domain-containing protein n=1 Tax=Planoprotostelium fungivorum TaxID=1890364 RepID=A0A2P6NLG9_9EUKA|nr:hypothetical protein PROFUN_07464 [Planoprotostelium fungivorum]
MGQSHSKSGVTFTQVHEHTAQQIPLDPTKHGVNHDCARIDILREDLAIACVTDGAGQLYWSEVASRLLIRFFVEELIEIIKQHEDDVKEGPAETFLYDAVVRANQRVLDYRMPDTNAKANIFDDGGGQTTLVGSILFHENNKWKLATVCTGDSLAYIYNTVDGSFQQITQNEGFMLPFHGLSTNGLPAVVLATIEPDRDIVVIVSDGVYDIFPDKKIPPIPLQSPGADELKDAIVAAVQSQFSETRGDPDDVTVVTLKLEKKNSEKNRTSTEVYPRTLSIPDITHTLFPEFKISMKLPWNEEYSYPPT